MSGNEVLFVRSSKKKNKSSANDTSTNDDDIWDDTILIKAYEKAVQLTHNEVMKKMQNSDKETDNLCKLKKKNQWKVGDKCRCEYSEDHQYYEANIIDIIDDLGMCIVKYVGYENEEKVPLHKLKSSKGEIARKLQINQALQDNGNSEIHEKKSELEYPDKFKGKKSHAGKKRAKDRGREYDHIHARDIYQSSSHFPQHPPTNTSIPPPPPPHLFGELSDDICESEAMSAMLMSWYMSGYHTGYYQGLKTARKK